MGVYVFNPVFFNLKRLELNKVVDFFRYTFGKGFFLASFAGSKNSIFLLVK